MGHVYLLVEIDKDGNERYKIGITKNDPEKRVKQLQTGNSGVVRLLQTYESANYKKVEQWLHGRYKWKQTEAKNEWFNLTDDEIKSFLDECKKADTTIQFLLKENPFFK
jgi:hypothetical protein